MYRIELTPGEEALFRNIDELAKGIQNGVISPNARIWHAASNKWLPIDFHPHYKIAKERPVAPPTAAVPVTTPAPAPSPFAPPRPAPVPAPVVPAAAAPAPAVRPTPAPVPEPVPAPVTAVAPAAPKAAAETPVPSAPPAPTPVTPAPARWLPKSRELHFIDLAPPEPKSAAEAVAPLPITPLLEQVAPQSTTPRHIEALVAIAKKSPLATTEPQDEPLIDIRPPRRHFKVKLNPRIAAIAAGVLLLAAAGGALVARGSAEPEPEPEPSLAVASTSLAATPQQPRPVPEPVEPSVAFRGNRAAEPVEVPATPVKDTTAPVVPRAPSLKSADLMSGGSAIVTDTYDPQVELENRLRASGFAGLFVPSRLAAGTISSTRLAVAGASGLVRKYREKASEPESNAGARTADALLSDIDAVLGILVGQEGGYEVSEGAIRFRDSASARQYGVLQARIASRLAAGNAGSPVVESLARVLGPAKLPVSGGVLN